MMKIAVGGKGGSGKTTLAGTLARQLSRQGVHPLLAIDGDTNPNLALTLGVAGAQNLDFDTIPKEIAERITDASGKVSSVLTSAPDEVLRDFGVSAPDDITLVLMGRVRHAGAGWLCRSHVAVRSLVGGLVENYDMPTVVDMEAGLEHLSRGTVRHVDTLLTVIEPYFKSMETAARMTELGRELGVPRVYAVANKVRSDDDREALQRFCQQRGLQLIAQVPDDEAVRTADRLGVAPLDHDPSAAAVKAVAELARELGNRSATRADSGPVR